MKLYIVRHGEAEREQVDPQKPLTEKGRSDVQKIANFLKSKNIQVDKIYHSTKTRAKQTAQILVDTLNPNCQLIEKKGLSPNDPIDPIYEEITKQTEDLMIVGHLPFIADLTSRFISGPKGHNAVAFRPAAIALLKKDEKQRWHLEALFSPAHL